MWRVNVDNFKNCPNFKRIQPKEKWGSGRSHIQYCELYPANSQMFIKTTDGI